MVHVKAGGARAVAVTCAAMLALAFAGVGAAGAATSTTVTVVKVPGQGLVLADSDGHTLYTLTDSSGAALPCTGQCANAWPPLTVAAGATGKAAKGVTKVSAASDGQVTWNALPVYRFAGDAKAKQAKGEGLQSFGGTWHVVKTKAAKATKKTETTSSGGNYGY
jgi:predicted lipoprotein with Yx(FWY)xxD motif